MPSATVGSGGILLSGLSSIHPFVRRLFGRPMTSVVRFLSINLLHDTISLLRGCFNETYHKHLSRQLALLKRFSRSGQKSRSWADWLICKGGGIISMVWHRGLLVSRCFSSKLSWLSTVCHVLTFVLPGCWYGAWFSKNLRTNLGKT